MAIRIHNHISKIQRSQPAKIKAVHPGMFIRFKYRKKEVFDDNPILLVLYKDYKENLVHGINLNYLNNTRMKVILEEVVKGASIYSESINPAGLEDQSGKYDDTMPYRNLLKKPYTRLKLPVFKEKREGNPISQSEAMRQMKMLYEKVIKKFIKRKDSDIYRTYHINRMSATRVLEFKFPHGLKYGSTKVI
jgi:hypothetical protein|tara:strand:+ start:1734 stop:2306 length:573 start_codon:yes stop_codon:yes gene_type:complete